MSRRRFRLDPFEILTYSLTLAIVVALRVHGLRVGRQAAFHTFGPMFASLPRVFVMGVVLQGLGLLLAWRSPRGWLRAVARPQSLFLWLRVWLAAMAMTFAYTWLKVCVPLLRSTALDPLFWRLDRALHFGFSPSIFATQLAHGTLLVPLLDRWYGIWVSVVIATLAYVFFSPDLAARRNFAFACAVLWLGGAFLYWALPAVGPCFTAPEVFTALAARMPHALAGQGELWRNYLTMIAGRSGDLYRFNPYLGVAAMPSLHVGAHWMFALWSRRHAPRLFLPFALATLLTFFASLVTGWHYAIDGYAGMLLAWLAVRLAERFEPAPSALATAPGTTPEAGVPIPAA